MCLQCDTNAVVIMQDVLPGFSLYQAQTDAPEWPKGWFGLVECGDPTVVFPGPLLADPTFGMSDEQLDAMPDFPAGYNAFTQGADAIGEKLVLPALAGYHLTKACIEQGYSNLDHGHLHYWLLHYLANKVGAQSESSAS